MQNYKNKKNQHFDNENTNQISVKKDEDNKKLKDDGNENILKLEKLPGRLDFRTSFLKKEYLSKILFLIIDALNSLHEYGANSFAQYLITSKDDQMIKQETITLVSQQYLSFKDFAEKLNIMTMKIMDLITSNSIQELCKKINVLFKQQLGSFEKMKLWVADNVNIY